MSARTWFRMLPVAFAFAATSVLAQEEPRGFYVGLSVGQSMVRIDDSFVTVAGATSSSVSKDETETGFKLYGGYRFHRNFALEAGWADLGTFRATRNVTAPFTGSATKTIEFSGPYIDAVGIFPLRQFALFGKAGAMFATTEVTRSATGAIVIAPGVAAREEESETEFKLGLGGSYSFTGNLAIRAEYEHFFDVGTDETDEGDIGLISVGIVFRF